MSYLTDENSKREIIAALHKFMADSALTYIKVHGFHWNVVGPHFKSIHELFDAHVDDLWESLDLVGERIRALGGRAPISFQELLNNASAINEIETVPNADIMLNIAYEDYKKLVEEAHKVEKIADNYGDSATVDIMTQRVETLEKMAWMTIANLQGSERK